MNNWLIAALTVWLFVVPADAGTIFVDTGGLATNSGSTDTNSPTVSGTAATNSGTTVTLDVSTNLGTVNTSGPNQTSINIAGATNTNRTIFWINSVTSGCTGTAVACVIVVDTAPTGLTTNSWSVGGRYLFTSPSAVDKAVAALRAGDTMQFNNNPTARTASFFNLPASGDSVSGFINIIGKAGSQILLDVGTSAVNVISINGQSGIYFKNLEFRQAGASAALIAAGSNAVVFDNVKLNHPSGGGTANGLMVAGTTKIINSEFTGTGGDCINQSVGGILIINSWIHGCGGSGINMTQLQPTAFLFGNVISNNTGDGINLSGASTTTAGSFSLIGNTIYSNSTAGLSVTNAFTVANMTDNIFVNDGTHPNVTWLAGSCDFTSIHDYNVFYAPSGTNLNNCTANATEFTTNPLLTNPAGGDFSISNSSPAAGSGTPGTPAGTSSTGFKDIGAIQRQVTAGGGGGTQVFGQ